MTEKIRIIFIFGLLLLFIHFAFCDNDSELLSVVVVFRHGDRTPVSPYPNDPYKNRSYWPVGFGQLTNRGKLQHFMLGKWFRSRYADFLPDEYSEEDIYVRCTDVDRTLMSASAHLAGLYPPKGDQIWDPDMLWQPIPIHTTPELEDPVLAMKKPCRKYQQLKDELFKSEFFRNVSHQNHDLYAYLSRYSGNTISTLETLEYLYNNLMIEQSFNFTLPDWTKPVFPKKMEPSAALSFATDCYTPELARLKTGLLFNEIIEFLQNRTKGAKRKYLIFSGHDTTIANVLNTMGAFQYHCPPYVSSIIFELRRSNSSNFINIFYKNSTELQKIVLKGCEFNCDLNNFKEILKPVLITLNEWNNECEISSLSPFVIFDQKFLIVIILSICGILFVILGTIAAGMKCRRGGKHDSTSYTQLPNDEIA